MRSSLTSKVVLVGLVVGVASIYGCSSGDSGNGSPFLPMAGSAGAPVGTSGSTGISGSSTGTSGSGTVAGSTSGGSTGTAGSGAGGMSGGTASTAGTGGGSAAGAGGSGTGGGGGTVITKVVPSKGCGMDPAGKDGAQTIATTGMKPALLCRDDNNAAVGTCTADGKGGPWSYTRDYNVKLPANYDKTKAYPLVFEGPGCGGHAADILNNYTLQNNANNTVIRVGLSPPPNDIIHATNPGEGCFDDKEGDDSVDWTFYENLYDKLDSTFCFDKNRVFTTGDSSGAWFSNELGCRYAGDAKRPVRGIMPNTGGLPNDDPDHELTCTMAPMAGIWVHDPGENVNPFTGNKFAIARAMKVNGCTIGNSYDNAMLDPWPVAGVPDGTCKKIKGCPDLYPLVVCLLPNTGHDSHKAVTNPAFAQFLTMFEGGAFLTQ